MRHRDVIKIMGKIITVNRALSRNLVEDNHWKWLSVALDGEYTGWVCGITYKNNGTCIRDYRQGRDPFDGSGQSAEWVTTSRVPCLLVKTWPNKKPEYVPLDGYVLGGKEPLSPSKISIEEFRSRVGDKGLKEHFNKFRGKDGRFIK